MESKIGCIGWSYKGWEGTFYPKTMHNSEHLKHYSSVFDVIEVNTTFYRIPPKSMTQKWYNDTPEDFIFTAKIPKSITHEGRLKPGPYLDQFLNSIKPLQTKMRVLVIQLPPSLSFKESKKRLDEMLDHLPDSYRYALEARHDSWFVDEVFDYLRERNLCLVWNEVEGVNNPATVTTDFVYLRLIGDRSIPKNEFGKIQLDQSNLIQKWADLITNIKDRIEFGIFMASNHLEGFAPVTANKLRVSLGLPYLTWTDKKQMTLD